MMTNTTFSRAAVARPGATLVVVLALLGTLSGLTETAHAQDVQVEGPLAGQPAVRHMRLYRAGRLRLMPTFGTTMQNEFTRALSVGLDASYGITDWLSIGVWGAYSIVQLDTALTDRVAESGVTTDRNRLSLPSRERFPNQVGNINWVTSLQLTFIPLRGKLSFVQKLFVDTDFYIFAGAALVGIEERANIRRDSSNRGTDGVCGEALPVDQRDQCLRDSQNARLNRMTVAPTFGVGLSMYFNDFIGLALEWRGMPFAWNTSGTDERGEGDERRFPDDTINFRDRIPHFNNMVSLGLIIYLPTAAEITD